MKLIDIEITINDDVHRLAVEPDATLLEVLHDRLGLKGTKSNCLEAECGVCTVLLDGAAIASCVMLAAQCDGSRVVTVEGLGTPEHLHPLQAAFIAHGAVQCGYCIPGMIMTAKSYLDENPGRPLTETEVREALAGTLCRCTGYQKIVAAVMSVAEVSRHD